MKTKHWRIRACALTFASLMALGTSSSPQAADSVDQPRRGSATPTSGVQRTQFRVANQHTSNPPARGSRQPQTNKSLAKKSLLAKAAHNEVITELPPEMVPGMPVVEAACGFEPGCGLEPGCGIEAGCGLEPGCGVPAASYCDGPGMCGGCNLCAGPNGCDAMPVYDAGCDTGMGGKLIQPLCYPVLLPVLKVNWSQFEIFGGVHAFSGPPSFAGPDGQALDARDGTASFGLMEGFNFTRPMLLFNNALTMQLGLMASQTNASGAEFTADNRKQLFFTGGAFRRVDYGLQGGVVVDYMYDDWYYNAHLVQLRGQLSWMMDPCNEFGYGFVSSLQDDVTGGVIRQPGGAQVNVIARFDPLDQHRFFYRRHFQQAGQFEMFAGFTDQDDGLLGMSLEVPLIDGLGLRTGFTYLNPDLSGGLVDNQEESWNIGMAFVWYPCGTNARSKYDRPMFNVADNGMFLMDQPLNP